MKIVFDTNAWEGPKAFEIAYFHCCYDENGIPIDIAIGADENTLEAISEFCTIGWNIRETQDCDELPYTATPELCTHEALYGRLRPFAITGSPKHCVTYY